MSAGPMDSFLGPPIYMTVLHSISVITCTYLFYNYYKLKRKALGLKMIIILGISDFIFHGLQIPLLWLQSETATLSKIGFVIVGAAFRFSIYWAANIAFFLYLLISQKNYWSPMRFTHVSIAILSMIATGLSAMFVLPEERYLSLMLLADATSPLAIILTGYFYLKSIKVLKSSVVQIGQQPQEIVKSLYRYACVQILTMGPLAVYFTIVDITNWNSEIANYIMVTPYGLTGFTNAVVYFFQRSKGSQETESSVALSELPRSKEISKDASISIITNPDLLRLSLM